MAFASASPAHHAECPNLPFYRATLVIWYQVIISLNTRRVDPVDGDVSHDVSRAHPETRRIPRRRARRFRARTLEPRPRNERIYNLSSWVRARCAIATSSVPRTRRRSETIRRRFECAGRRSTARSDAARGRARRSATASDGWKSFTSFVARAGGVASSRARRGRTRSRGTTRPAIRRAGAGHRLIEG